MRRRPGLLFGALLLLILPATSLNGAQPAEESWQNLQQLHSGEEIEVVTTQMKSHRGQFAASRPTVAGRLW